MHSPARLGEVTSELGAALQIVATSNLFAASPGNCGETIWNFDYRQKTCVESCQNICKIKEARSMLCHIPRTLEAANLLLSFLGLALVGHGNLPLSFLPLLNSGIAVKL